MSFRQWSIHQGSVSVKVQEVVAVASPVAQQVSTRSSSLGVRVGGLSLTRMVEGEKEPTASLVSLDLHMCTVHMSIPYTGHTNKPQL